MRAVAWREARGRVTKRRGLPIALAAASASLVGCEGIGADVVRQIDPARSLLIAEVVYIEPYPGPKMEQITVYLVPDITAEQVVEAWCGVIVPAGIDQLPGDGTSLWRAGTLDPDNLTCGSTPLNKPPCPSPGTLPPSS